MASGRSGSLVRGLRRVVGPLVAGVKRGVLDAGGAAARSPHARVLARRGRSRWRGGLRPLPTGVVASRPSARAPSLPVNAPAPRWPRAGVSPYRGAAAPARRAVECPPSGWPAHRWAVAPQAAGGSWLGAAARGEPWAQAVWGEPVVPGPWSARAGACPGCASLPARRRASALSGVQTTGPARTSSKRRRRRRRGAWGQGASWRAGAASRQCLWRAVRPPWRRGPCVQPPLAAAPWAVCRAWGVAEGTPQAAVPGASEPNNALEPTAPNGSLCRCGRRWLGAAAHRGC